MDTAQNEVDPTQDADETGASQEAPVFDLRLKWTASERDDFGKKMMDKIRFAINSRNDRDDRIRAWRSQFEAVLLAKNWPWPNAASLNVPFTRSIVETQHASIYKAMTGVSPLFRTLAYQTQDIPVANKVERLLEWQMMEQVGFPTVLDQALLCGLRDGTGIFKVDWVKQEGEVVDIGLEIDPVTQQQTSVLVAHNETVRDEPQVKSIDILDFFMYPAQAVSIDAAIGVGNRIWLTQNDLLIGAESGSFDPGQVDKLLKSGAEKPDPFSERHGGDEEKQQNVGVNQTPLTDPEDQPYELFDCIWLYDADGDGIKEDCHFVIESSTGIIIWDERYPYFHGRRNYIAATPYPRPNSFYGYSTPEILEDLQSEYNAIRNQRVDAGTLVLSPVIGMSRSTLYDPQKQRWRPGMVIRTAGKPADELYPLTLPNVTQQAFSEENAVKEMGEKVTGVSDYTQGASPSRSRTLGEISQVIANGNLKLDVVISRLHVANTEIAAQIIGLDKQFLSAKTEFALTGDRENIFDSITSEQVRTRVRIVPQGNTINSNAELKMQGAETLYQMAQTNPLINNNIVRMWAVTNNLLMSHGILNPEPFIGTLDDAQAQQQSMANQPPKGEPPSLSGKMDPVTTLAVMLQEDPSLLPILDQAAMVMAKYNGEVAAGAALAAEAANRMSQQGQPQPGQPQPGGGAQQSQPPPISPGQPGAAPTAPAQAGGVPF